ncbi:MAG: hypothetical protein QNI91_17335 [Arenicellales bacterium]|nr:hypothetical protein [Arenicellales bacterium]
MQLKSFKHNYLVIIGILSLVGFFSLRYFLLQTDSPYSPIVVTTPQTTAKTTASPAVDVMERLQFDTELEQEMVLKTEQTVREIGEDLATLLKNKEFGLLRDSLLNKAAQAVVEGNKSQLAHVLSLLGQVAVEEQDLDAAEVYLLEALDVYENLNDKVGSAQVYMQLGRTHVKARELARTAGDAYDRLLIARWQLSEQHFAAAEQNLKHVIDESLAVNRFGAAASAYYSLVQLYTKSNSAFQAEQAAMEAANLYAASGQLKRAYDTVASLKRAGIETWRVYDIEQEIERSYAEFERSVQQIERAKDYRQLYYHYRSQGDQERAWNLRLLASKSLKNVSKRAMFHRQPDALALLYVSNDDMGRAKDYFDRAKQTFDSKGLEKLSAQTEKLKDQIF